MDNNKQTKGRQRIDTSKRRESEEDRLITFSKRRSGLYKKGSELCTLCGTQLAILIFSPSGKPFSFAHPNIEVIARRVLETNPRSDDQDSNGVMDACRRKSIDELNEQLTLISNEVEYEKERGTKLAQTTKARQNKPLCEQKIDELSDDYDVQKLKAWLLELQARINNRLEELNVTQATHPSAVGTIDGNASSSSYGYGGIHFKNFN